MTEFGVYPEPGTPERIADDLETLAGQLQQAADKLRVLAGELREVEESLKNWQEVAMRAGEKAAEEIDWERPFHPPPVPPEEKRTIVFHLERRVKDAVE